jgi:multidrug efflux pump subunit AcrA (membrane-fusion protein)
VAAESSQTGLTGLGSVRYRRILELSFEQPGLIAEMAVKEEQQGKRGQVLASLDEMGALNAVSPARPRWRPRRTR